MSKCLQGGHAPDAWLCLSAWAWGSLTPPGSLDLAPPLRPRPPHPALNQPRPLPPKLRQGATLVYDLVCRPFLEILAEGVKDIPALAPLTERFAERRSDVDPAAKTFKPKFGVSAGEHGPAQNMPRLLAMPALRGMRRAPSFDNAVPEPWQEAAGGRAGAGP